MDINNEQWPVYCLEQLNGIVKFATKRIRIAAEFTELDCGELVIITVIKDIVRPGCLYITGRDRSQLQIYIAIEMVNVMTTGADNSLDGLLISGLRTAE